MANFTPQELEEILQQFFDVTGKRQYIGARYVPIFGRKDESSIEWDNSKPYEPLTIVLYQGNSYTSRTYVPVGVGIDDTYFWANTGNYNAQVEAYREEVLRFNDRITTNENDIDALEDALPKSDFSSTNTVKKYIDDATTEINEIIPSNDFSSTNTVKKYIDDATTEINEIIPSNDFSSTNTVKKYIDDVTTEINDTIEALENVLPKSDFSATNTVKKYIDDANLGAKELAQATRDFTNAKIIWIGDSFSDPNYEWGDWVAGLAAYLGCPIYNYAESGMGFVSREGYTNTFLNQVTAGLTEHPDATDIVVYGGNNDIGTYTSAYATFATAVSSFFAYLSSNLPTNCRVHVFLCNAPTSNGTVPWGMRYAVQEKATLNGVRIFNYPYVNALQLMYGGFFSSSNQHPSVSFANNQLKWYFAESLLCGICIPTNELSITLESGWNVSGYGNMTTVMEFVGDICVVHMPEAFTYNLGTSPALPTGTIKLGHFSMPQYIPQGAVGLRTIFGYALASTPIPLIGYINMQNGDIAFYGNSDFNTFVGSQSGTIYVYFPDITFKLPS